MAGLNVQRLQKFLQPFGQGANPARRSGDTQGIKDLRRLLDGKENPFVDFRQIGTYVTVGLIDSCLNGLERADSPCNSSMIKR